MHKIMGNSLKYVKNNTKKTNVKIYEMFMRDGLQSFNKTFTLEKKLEFTKLLNQCGFHCIELGSTVSPTLIPQMENSYELFKQTQKNPNTKYTMLVPGLFHISKALQFAPTITSFGLVCSVSDVFASKNQKKTAKDTLKNVFEQINLINTNLDKPHIRVYISCSFGSPWENFDNEYLSKLNFFTTELLQYAIKNKISSNDFDIVIADTVGLSSQDRIDKILKMLWLDVCSDQVENEYFAMHIHSTEDKFKKIIGSCVLNNIFKFDSSMCGIGGCPFAEDNALGNISTVSLISFLQSLGYYKQIDIKYLEYIENELKKLL